RYFISVVRSGLPRVSGRVAFRPAVKLAHFSASNSDRRALKAATKAPRKASPHPTVFTTLKPARFKPKPRDTILCFRLYITEPIAPSSIITFRFGLARKSLRAAVAWVFVPGRNPTPDSFARK